MKNTVFEIVKNGLFKEVSAPVYGKQDVGITPGGAMDRFSFQVGNILLGNPADSPAFEIVIAPKFRFKQDCCFVLTGAEYRKVTLTEDSDQAVAVETVHGTVCFAPSGSTLKFGRKIYGFRTYLCYTPVDGGGEDILGRSWNEFRSVCDCTDPNRKVRVLEGPEYEYLNDPDPFLNNTWETTRDISEMGMRLASSGEMP
ncbi:MAG: hypothetical protein GY866_16220, partial [Proteobacteria bacterium]|nr:hypothetical protein [Pseudomonadota bacterium]